MNIGIVYATNSKMIRRIVGSDDPNYDYSIHVDKNSATETLLLVDASLIKTPDDCAAQVKQATGQVPLDFNCAVVDQTGAVTSLVKADPTIDVLPGATLIAAPDGVDVGHTYDAKNGVFNVPEKQIPATTGKDGSQIDAQVIPAKVLPAIDAAAVIAAAKGKP